MFLNKNTALHTFPSRGMEEHSIMPRGNWRLSDKNINYRWINRSSKPREIVPLWGSLVLSASRAAELSRCWFNYTLIISPARSQLAHPYRTEKRVVHMKAAQKIKPSIMDSGSSNSLRLNKNTGRWGIFLLPNYFDVIGGGKYRERSRWTVGRLNRWGERQVNVADKWPNKSRIEMNDAVHRPGRLEPSAPYWKINRDKWQKSQRQSIDTYIKTTNWFMAKDVSVW